MARRKRIPYDPPSNRKKRRHRQPIPRAEQLFLTRRMFLIKGAVVSAFGALAGKLGYMQIVQRQVYEQKALDNQLEFRRIKAPRGMIFDRKGRELAVNRRSWEVRVIPADLPEDPAQRRYVLDAIINALDLPEAAVIDPSAVPEGSEETVYRRVAQVLGREPDGDEGFVAYCKRAAEINYLVNAEDALTPDQAAMFRSLLSELPGVQIINQLDYRIGNIGDQRTRVVAKTDVSREIALKLEANKLYLPGVELDDSVLVRRYTGGEVMSHIIGYAQGISDEEFERSEKEGLGYEMDDSVGKDGLEFAWEGRLRGNKGGHYVEVDAGGIVVGEVGAPNPAIPGRNIKLTIDLEFQAAVSQILQDGIEFSNADRQAKMDRGDIDKFEPSDSGAVVAIDPRTGEVLALVSYPHFDNQLFVDGISQRKVDEYNDEKAGTPYLNRATRGVYPPGSTLKIFLAASALQDGKITTETTFTCTGEIMVPLDWNEAVGNSHPCWWADGHQTLDVLSGIERSCDIFFYNVGAPKDRPQGADLDLHYYDVNPSTGQPNRDTTHFFAGLGIQGIKKYLQQEFWFGQPTNIDITEEAGVVPDPDWLTDFTDGQDSWSLSATINVAIGQGYFGLTPLQLALNTAAIGSRGTIYRPLLVRETVDDAQQTVQQFEPEVLRRMTIDERHIDVVREGMRRVVHEQNGTAHHTTNRETNEQIPKWPLTNPPDEEGILIAGKTGTAEAGVPDINTGEYPEQHAWFTAFAPLDDPEIAVAVVVERGGEGATYAVPVVDRVLRAYFELTGRRSRGKVLRADGQPAINGLTLSDAAGVPAPGATDSQSID